MKNKKEIKGTLELLSGNLAAATAVKLARVQVIPAYPITPATTIPEQIASFVESGKLKAEFLCSESEHSAMASAIGAAAVGARVFTATSSQGLLLMTEMIYWAAGARLPIVMVNVNRAICAPWALWADHNDSMSVKDAGWIQLYCKNAQEVLDSILMGYKLGEKKQIQIPVMIVYEGFTVSHAYEPVIVPRQESVDQFLPPRDPKYKLDIEDPRTIGGLLSPSGYAETQYQLHEAMSRVPAEAERISREFQKTFDWKTTAVLETVRAKTAPTIFVCMGTMAETVREVIRENPDFGLIRIKMFRPFPVENLKKILGARIANGCPIRKIIVLDHSLSRGQGGHLWMELRHCFYSFLRQDVYRQMPHILGYVTGLSGEDITPAVIRNILQHAQNNNGDQKSVMWRR